MVDCGPMCKSSLLLIMSTQLFLCSTYLNPASTTLAGWHIQQSLTGSGSEVKQKTPNVRMHCLLESGSVASNDVTSTAVGWCDL